MRKYTGSKGGKEEISLLVSKVLWGVGSKIALDEIEGNKRRKMTVLLRAAVVGR